MMIYNFHTHSYYDDGREPLEDYVKSAIDKGMTAIGFSGHAPLPFYSEWSIEQKNYPDYLAEVHRLKEQYKGRIDIYLGLETDYIPGFVEDIQPMIEEGPLDYVVGSVHLVIKPGGKTTDDIWFIDGPREGYIRGLQDVFGGDARAATEAYFNQQTAMVNNQRPNIIGHLDKVNMHNHGELFDPEEEWYGKAVDRLLDAIAKHGTIVELNTRGVYRGKTENYFPETAILRKCLQREIPVMVNTDAHHPSQLDEHFDLAVKHLKAIGYNKMTTPFFEVPLA